MNINNTHNGNTISNKNAIDGFKSSTLFAKGNIKTQNINNININTINMYIKQLSMFLI